METPVNARLLFNSMEKNDEERSQTDKTKMREKKFNIILQGDVIFIKNFKGIKKLFIRVY